MAQIRGSSQRKTVVQPTPNRFRGLCCLVKCYISSHGVVYRLLGLFGIGRDIMEGDSCPVVSYIQPESVPRSDSVHDWASTSNSERDASIADSVETSSEEGKIPFQNNAVLAIIPVPLFAKAQKPSLIAVDSSSMTLQWDEIKQTGVTGAPEGDMPLAVIGYTLQMQLVRVIA